MTVLSKINFVTVFLSMSLTDTLLIHLSTQLVSWTQNHTSLTNITLLTSSVTAVIINIQCMMIGAWWALYRAPFLIEIGCSYLVILTQGVDT